ncbi:MAG TPA: gamma carbonic anhydrase family protein [Rhodopseudomonas sp.]|uniref:gamma carbonic anhydrase family protein n=1 Tax=Rhodopseudomonas sp. TaxID=1078 RepID=UPI002ED80127
MTLQSELLTACQVLSYEGTAPYFAGEPAFAAVDASVLGKVRIGARAWLGPASVIRADGHFVRIGDDFSIGSHATVHIAHELYPTLIGDRVTVGSNAVVHACTVGDDCVIEDDVVILDGSIVGDQVVIERGAVVYPRSTLQKGSVYAGAPAKRVAALAPAEQAQRKARLREAAGNAAVALRDRAAAKWRPQAFVARTADLAGQIDLGANASVFFSCVLHAEGAAIVVGDNSNIQDNTRIFCSGGGVVIGRDTTIGHNVQMMDCRIGDRCLVGIGSVVNPGTVIEDDVLLAAGAETEPGQRLQSGALYAGRPARAIAKLDSAKRTMMAAIIAQYCGYAEVYRAQQSRFEEQGACHGT